MNRPDYRKVLRCALCFCLVTFVTACDQARQPSSPEVLRMGVLPDVRASTLETKYEPLVEYLTEELEQEVRLVIPDDYAHLVRLFGEGEVDIAYFGGATFVSSEAENQAVPLVMRDIDTRFTSYFLARFDAEENQISEFENQVIGFGSELSTSGHYMPRYFLKVQAIDPETFFRKVLYSGAHDKTVEMLLEGQVDLAVANAEVVDSMLRRGKLTETSVKVVWETPVYSDYVWAAQPGWSETYTIRVTDAFLQLSRTDTRGSEIMELLGGDGFLPATPSDFNRLRAIVLQGSGNGGQADNQEH